MPSRILLVDDEEELCDVMAFQLEDEGFQVSQAYNAPEALSRYEEARPDIILSDLNMPKGSGLELLDSLKKHPNFSNCQFFIFSGFISDGDEEGLLAKGIDGVIRKPVSFNNLLKTITHKPMA